MYPQPPSYPHPSGSATAIFEIYHPVDYIKVRVNAENTDQVVSLAVIPSFPKVTLSQ